MDAYLQRGVSSDKAEVKKAVARLSPGLYPDTFCKILPDYWAGDAEYAIAAHTDTAGSKTALAYLYWRETGDLSVWRGIVQDAVVMNLDDLLCIGATDNFVFTTTVARNRNLIPAEVIETLVAAGEEYLTALTALGVTCVLGGGETADVGDVVRTIDVGYSAAVRLKRAEIIRIAPQAGDVVVGFASDGKTIYETEENSGIGCNGLTLARHLLFKSEYRAKYPETYDPKIESSLVYSGNYAVTDVTPESAVSVGKLALSPTRAYTPVLKPIIEKYRAKIHGVVHNTGGGHTKVKRFLQNVDVIKDNLDELPLVFRLIQEAGNFSGENLKSFYQTFNTGYRLEIYTDAETAVEIIQAAEVWGLTARVIGYVTEGSGRVIIKKDKDFFVYD